MMKYLSYILIFISVVVISCTEPLQPKPYTYSQLLTGENVKFWRLEGLQFRQDDKAPQSFEVPDDCVFDDLYVFYATDDRKFEIQEGATKCNPEDPDVFLTESWSLTSGRATLEFVIPILAPFKLPYIVQELTENRLVVEIYFNENKQSYRMIFGDVRSE